MTLYTKRRHIRSDTDWAAVKCMKLGLSLEQEYPEIYDSRNTYRRTKVDIRFVKVINRIGKVYSLPPK